MRGPIHGAARWDVIDWTFSKPWCLKRLRSGPLGSHSDGFAELLWKQGYSAGAAKPKVRLIGRLGNWLTRRKLCAEDLNESNAAQFLRWGYKTGQIDSVSAHRTTLRSLLGYLRELGVVSLPTTRHALHPILRDYKHYLERERGLAPATVVTYIPLIRVFIEKTFGKRPPRFARLRSKAIIDFIRQYASKVSPGHAKNMVAVLRSFLSFLRLRGKIALDLAGCVPTIPNWRRSGIPRFLEPGQVRIVLKSCDQRGAIGRRDYAILLLLARMGLRAGEIVALTLDDIDWEAGKLTIRGKGSRQDQLPLPMDVGRALVAYLQRGRPQCSTRQFFVRTKAPLGGISSSATVDTVVAKALARVDLNPANKGAHLLRHSLATHMLRKGASLREIGEILRHRNADTTRIYAKVDLRALRALAQVWPRGR